MHKATNRNVVNVAVVICFFAESSFIARMRVPVQSF